MKIQLINGRFEAREALELITRMVHAKITFHEEKISAANTEEDIKMREKRIRELQKDLFELRNRLKDPGRQVDLSSSVELL